MGSQKDAKGNPKWPSLAPSDPMGLTIPPKMKLKRYPFRNCPNMRILKDVPYGINDFGVQRLWKATQEAAHSRSGYPSGSRSSYGGAQEQPEGIHGDPGGSWRALGLS